MQSQVEARDKPPAKIPTVSPCFILDWAVMIPTTPYIHHPQGKSCFLMTMDKHACFQSTGVAHRSFESFPTFYLMQRGLRHLGVTSMTVGEGLLVEQLSWRAVEAGSGSW